MDILSGMRAFVATVDANSFSQAARHLRISKAALSKKVVKLEDHLGVRLLHRTTRKLSLTGEGRIYVERARDILAEVHDAETAVSPFSAEPRGKLRISAPHTFGSMYLTGALTAFLKLYPLIDMDIEFSDRLVDLVDDGFDVAVRITKLKDSSLIARKLAPAPIVVCASPAYWQKHGIPRHPRELSHRAGKHQGVIYAYLSTPGEWTFREDAKPFTVKIKGALTTNSDIVIRDSALNGIGIFHGPSFIVMRELRQGRLVCALEDFQQEPLAVYAVYSSKRNLSPKVRAFVDFLVEWFRHTPDGVDAG